MFCYQCGKNTAVEDEFCPKCGANQKIDLSAENQLRTPTENSISTVISEMSPTKKAWSIAGILLIILLLFSALGGGGSGLNIFGNGALNQPAVDFIMPGDASITLQQVWGVELNGSSGPVTLRDMADQAFDYNSYVVGGGITKSDVEIAFQPGNSMHSFFNRLLNSQQAIDAVKEQWLSRAE
jgi:hypothetical protein